VALSLGKRTIEHFIWRKQWFSEDNITPLFHYRMVEHWLYSDTYIKPVKAFRGSAKSTNMCYMALHRVENPNAFYTLIVSDTATQAESLIDDIAGMIDSSSLPYKVKRSVQGEIELEYKGRTYYIAGKGAGSSLRGIKKGRRRPDLIVIDDLLNDELVMNRMRVDRLSRWWFSALLPSLEPKGEVWAVGTPFSLGDIFTQLTQNHPTLEVPLEEGVWEDRFGSEWIRDKKREYEKAGMLREWKREYELILADSETQIFDTKRITTITKEDVPSGLTYFCTLDGAFSEKDSADYSAFAVLGIGENGRWFLFPYAMRANPQAVIDFLFSLHLDFGFSAVGIEKGQFLLSMRMEIENRMFDTQQWFNIEQLSTTGSKIARIKALVPIVNSGKFTVVDTGEVNGVDAPDMLMEQLEMADSEAVRSAHDDVLDAVCQLVQMPLMMINRE